MSKGFKYSLIGMVLVMLIAVVPLPYYITMPGMADDLRKYVKVEGATTPKGELLFTTVSMQQANLLGIIKANLTPFYEVEKRDTIIPSGESNEDYNKRQLYYMKESQDAAIMNAYKYANKSINIKNEGAVVLALGEGMPAKGVLRVGDIIIGVENQPVQTSQDLIAIIDKKKVGEQITLEYIREKEKEKTTLTLVPLPQSQNRAGIGVVLTTSREVTESPKVAFNMQDIGGPSAGLMFTLEIMDQLVDSDITKGYKIAGTGEIDENGVVGPIGGISQKIVAASREGAEIFFAPNEKGAVDSNYNEAVKTAKEIKTTMKIVPVDTIEDALHYLEMLQ